MPVVRFLRAKGGSYSNLVAQNESGGLSPSRGQGGVLKAGAETIPPQRGRQEHCILHLTTIYISPARPITINGLILLLCPAHTQKIICTYFKATFPSPPSRRLSGCCWARSP